MLFTLIIGVCNAKHPLRRSGILVEMRHKNMISPLPLRMYFIVEQVHREGAGRIYTDDISPPLNPLPRYFFLKSTGIKGRGKSVMLIFFLQICNSSGVRSGAKPPTFTTSMPQIWHLPLLTLFSLHLSTYFKKLSCL